MTRILCRPSFAALDWPSSFCVIPSQRLGCGQASPSSFLRSDGLRVMAEKESRNCALSSSSAMPRTWWKTIALQRTIFVRLRFLISLSFVRNDGGLGGFARNDGRWWRCSSGMTRRRWRAASSAIGLSRASFCVIPSQRLGCGQASPSSFLRSDGLRVMAEKESRNCALSSSSTMPRTWWKTIALQRTIFVRLRFLISLSFVRNDGRWRDVRQE
jgi:hypothetical protein